MQSQFTQILFRLAWADGRVKPEEVDLIDQLLKEKGLALAQRLVLMDQGLSQPPAGMLADDAMSEAERLECMEALVKVCFIDQDAENREITLLGDLALRWGVSAQQLEQLRSRL